MAKYFTPLDETDKGESVFLPAMARSAGGMVTGTGHLLSALGAEALGKGLQQYGTEVEQKYPAQYSGMAGFAKSPWGFAKETLGEVIPTAVGMALPAGLAGKAATRLLTAEKLAAPVVQIAPSQLLKSGLMISGKEAAVGAGAGLGSTAMETGDILGQQMEEIGRYDRPRALGYGAAAGALDVPLGVGGVITRGIAGTLGKQAAAQGWKTIPKEMLKVGTQEALQEGVQTGLEMQGVKPSGFVEKAATAQGIDDLLTSMVKGFIGGGAFGTVSGGAKHLAERAQLKAEAEAALDKNKSPEPTPEEQKQQTVQETAQRAVAEGQAELFPGTERAGPVQSLEEIPPLVTKDEVTGDLFQQIQQAVPSFDGLDVTEGEIEEITIGGVSPNQAVEVARALKLYEASTRDIGSGATTDINTASRVRDLAINILRKNGVEPADAELTPEQLFTQGQQQVAVLQAQRRQPVTPEVARKTAAVSQRQINDVETAAQAILGTKGFSQTTLNTIAARVIPLGSVQAMASELMALSEGSKIVKNDAQRAKLHDLAMRMGYTAAPEVAEITPKPQQPETPAKISRAPVSAKERVSEKVTPEGEGVVAPVAREEVAGAGAAVARKAGAEIKPPVAEQVTRHGAPTTEGKSVKAETPNAIQKRGAETAPVGQAPGNRAAVGQGVPESGKTAEQGGNAPTKKLSKEEVAKRVKEGKLGEEVKQAGEVTITIYDKAGVAHTFINKKEAAAFRKSQQKVTPKQVVEDLAGEETREDEEATYLKARALEEAMFPGRERRYRSIHPLPNQSEYDSAVKKGGVTEVLALVKNRFADNPALQNIFKWVEQKAGDVKIKYVDEDMTDDYGRYIGAAYDPATHTIEVYQNGSNPVVLAHELVHAAMEREVQIVEYYAKGNGARSESMEQRVKAYNELKQQYYAFKKAIPDSAEYGLTDFSEFLAEVFSNPDFRAVLQTQPKVNLWQRILRAISEFLGLKSDGARALDDMFAAAQVLAYRDSMAAYTPPEFRKVYSTKSAMYDRLHDIDELVRDKDWVDKNWWLNGGSKVGDAFARGLLWSSSTHNIVELAKARFAKILTKLGARSNGIADYWTAAQKSEGLGTQLNNDLAHKGEKVYRWIDADKKRADKAMYVRGEMSILRLTEDQSLQLAKGNIAYKDLVAQRKRDIAAKVETNMVVPSEAMHDRIAALKSALIELGYDKQERFKPWDKLDKDSLKWTAADVVHLMNEQAKEASLRYYDTALRTLYFQYAGKTHDALKVFSVGEERLDAANFNKSYIKLNELIEKMRDTLSESARNKFDADRKVLDKLRDNALAFPYAHITRKGEFFASLVRPAESADTRDAVVALVRFKSQREMEQHIAELTEGDGVTQLKDMGLVLHSGRLGDFVGSKAVEGMRQLADRLRYDISGMAELKPEIAERMEDLVKQALFEMMPEVSTLKNFIHRKGQPGWNPREQFEGHIAHLATSNFHYANNRYLAEREFHIDAMRQAVREAEDTNDPDRVQLSRIVNEVMKRHSQSFIDMETPLVDWGRALVYHWQLAWSPAYLLTNLLQPYMFTLPTLGAKYGFTNTTKALMNGYEVALKVIKAMTTHGLLETVTHEEIVKTLEKAGLAKNEWLAVQHMLDSDKIEFTLAKEAGMLARGEGTTKAKVSKFLSLGSHYTEVINRIATGVAAYELERDRTKDVKAAEKMALWAIDETQVYYSRMNMPRAMGKHGVFSKVTPLFTTFMFFNINVMEKYLRHLRAMLPNSGLSKAEQKEAWQTFGGMLLTTASVAGTMGLPMMSVIMYALSAMGGDDDEPFDAQMALRRYMTEGMGIEPAYAAAYGLPALFGVDLHSRAGQHDIMPLTRLFTDHRNLADLPTDAFLKNLSPTLSTGLGIWNAVPRVFDWMEGDMAAGDAVIRALPAAMRGAATSLHGYYDYKGTELPEKNTMWQEALQMLGISPVWRNRQYELTMFNRNEENQLKVRAKQIQTHLVHAIDDGDVEDSIKWREQARAFVAANPNMASLVAPNQMLKQINKDRAMYRLTGMGSAVSPKRFQEVYGIAQELGVGDEEGD